MALEDLEVWKRASNRAGRMYEELGGCIEFGLKEQMTRAAVSSASNIAEGAERDTKPEVIRFLHIAKGSAAELRTQVLIAGRIGILAEPAKTDIVEELVRVSSMIHGLIKSLKRSS